MSEDSKFIGLKQWLSSPPGGYVLAWEQAGLDAALSDVFGFHAVQLGLPELQALRSNRMPHRWLVGDATEATGEHHGTRGVVLKCDFDALPFETQSLDLLVMAHSLELARDPHLALREAERVLVPEGRLVILGFNPRSLWGLRQQAGRLKRHLGMGRHRPLYLPHESEFIGYRRLRDWLRLLSFEVEAGHFGCYRPPLASDLWLSRWHWAEKLGDRWWPVFGAVYMVVAVKRVRGMRLVGLAKKERPRSARAPAVVTHTHTHAQALPQVHTQEDEF